MMRLLVVLALLLMAAPAWAQNHGWTGKNVGEVAAADITAGTQSSGRVSPPTGRVWFYPTATGNSPQVTLGGSGLAIGGALGAAATELKYDLQRSSTCGPAATWYNDRFDLDGDGSIDDEPFDVTELGKRGVDVSYYGSGCVRVVVDTVTGSTAADPAMIWIEVRR